MSISNITGVDGKIIPGVLPNPYPFPASAGLGDVLAVSGNGGNPIGGAPQSMTNIGNIGCANITAPFGAIQALDTSLIEDAGGLGNIGIIPNNNLSLLPQNNLIIKGAQTKGSILVGDGTSTKELIVPVAPALPNGSVLILDSTQPLGVKWGGESGDINSITPGNNIDISGPSANPIVALQSPLTATLALGAVSMTAGNPATQTNAFYTNSNTQYIASATAGGNLLAVYGAGYISLFDPLNNQKSIGMTAGTGIQLTDQTTPPQIVDNTITDTQVQIKSVNGLTSSLTQATLTNQALQYVNTDSTITPTLTNTSTYDNCSRTAVSLNNSTGETATRTEIIDFNLQNKQEQTLVNGNNTTTIKSNCELDFSNYPYSYFQLNTTDINTINTGFGATSTFSQAEMSSIYENFIPGSEAQHTGNIISQVSGSSMTLSANDITAGATQVLNVSCSPAIDARIDHSSTGFSPTKNLVISSSGRIDLQSTNLSSDANGLEVNSTNVGGQANPLLVLQNSNTTAGAVVFETYKNDAPTSTGGDAIGAWSAYCNATTGVSPLKTEMTRISAVANGVGAGNNDGSLLLACKVNSSAAPVNFINCNGGAAPSGEIQLFKPINVVGNSIRTSQGDITLDTTASTGTGLITMSAKADVDITGTSCAVSSVSGGNTGALFTNAGSVELEATNTLIFTGAGLQSNTAGGNSGEHLVITLNGVVYKIKLELP
jgi:hypothetical protein